MDFEFSADALMLRDLLRRFLLKEVRPLEARLFAQGELQPGDRARLRGAVQQMGLWGALVPEAFGGLGLDHVTACLVAEELGSTFVPLELGEVTPLLYACRGEQVARYLQPALAGERRAIIAAREKALLRPRDWTACADSAGEGFVLNGRKLLAELPGEQDFLIVLAREPAGQSAFLVEATSSGVRLERNGDIVLALSACPVGRDAVLGEPGRALAVDPAEAARAWLRAGARATGLAQRLLDMAAAHAREWESWGAPLAVRPGVRSALAELRVDVESTRWLVYHAAWLADRGEGGRAAAAAARLAGVRLVQRALDQTTLVYGGPGPLRPGVLDFARGPLPGESLGLAVEAARAILAADVLAAEA